MKVVFYKSIMGKDGLTPTDKVVFCQSLYLSLMSKDNAYAFDANGKFIHGNMFEENGGYIPMSWRVNESFILSCLGISKMQYYLSMRHLKEKGYIIKNEYGEKFLYAIKPVPYFELKVNTGLRGLELIVYSYLADKEKIAKKDGWVDKYHNAIAKDLNLPMSNEKKSSRCLERILYRLAKKGYLKRSRHGSYRVWLKTTLPGER